MKWHAFQNSCDYIIIFSDRMSAFTCITCRVIFLDGETQREHYKTDWHRYNLKRKIAELQPVTAENFKLRVENAQKTTVSRDLPENPCNAKSRSACICIQRLDGLKKVYTICQWGNLF